MKKFLVIALSLFVVVSCSESSETDSAAADQVEAKADENVVTANTLLSMEVTGMACEMACGGSIKDKLMETGAVTKVEFEFEDGRETNIALISYDDSKISDDEIEEIVLELNDGQFTVGSMSMEPIEDETSSVETSSSNETAVVEASGSYIELPNLVDILSGWLSF